MNKNNMRRLLSFILCIVLIAATALLAAGCKDKTTPEKTVVEVIEKGEGKTSFNFEVTDIDGKTTRFLIKTDKTTVGDALLELGLIVESTTSAGIFVTVNGISADYNKDGAWWQLFVNGESATKGAKDITIEPGATYSFVKTPA